MPRLCLSLLLLAGKPQLVSLASLMAVIAVLSLLSTQSAQGITYNVVDLNPAGFVYSGAYGFSGSQQVGAGTGPVTGNQLHALLWSGSASSAVDLNPADFTGSAALVAPIVSKSDTDAQL